MSKWQTRAQRRESKLKHQHALVRDYFRGLSEMIEVLSNIAPLVAMSMDAILSPMPEDTRAQVLERLKEQIAKVQA